MQISRRRSLGSWVVLALGAALLAVVPGQPATAADPPPCLFPGPHYEWTGEVNDRWGQVGNWNEPPGLPPVPNDNPNGNGSIHTDGAYVCIPAGVTVRVGEDGGVNHYLVQAFYLGQGATIDILIGNSLAAESTTQESFAAPGSTISVTSGTFGGPAQIRTRGTVVVSATPDGGVTLSSRAPFFDPPASPGRLVVDTDGQLLFPSLGINVQQRYHIELRGTGRSVVSGSGAIGANYGTRFEIGQSAVLTFAGPGGYYQGNSDGFTTLSQLVNAGRLVKTGGGTSVIDADYTEVGAGEMIVEWGTVAFPDGTTFPARVQPGQRMSTEQCAPTSGFQACAVETNPLVDPQSISLGIPSGDPGGAFVEVREHQVLGSRAAQRAGPVVFDGFAHAAGLRVDPRQPAVIEMRFDERRASGRALENLAVYQDDREIQTCLGTTGAPSLGQVACIDRRGRADSTRKFGGNFYVVVRATQTSRWKVRRELEDVAAPTIYTAEKQKKGDLGEAVKVKTKCDEDCTLKARGYVKVKGLGKLRLQKDIVKAKANKRATLRLVLTRASARKLANSNARKGKATVTFKATDDAGNSVRQRVTVKLR